MLTIMITPLGGASNLPLGLNGQPGPAPQLTCSVTTLAAGSAPTATLVETDPGAPGVPSAYLLTLGLPLGNPGVAGAAGSILNSSSFSNSPANGQVPVYNSASQLCAWATLYPPIPLYVVPGTNFTPLSMTSAQSSGIICDFTIPAQTFRYRPRVNGDLEVVGASGMRIDAQVMMGLATSTDATIAASGTQVAYGRGPDPSVSGTSNPVHLGISPLYGVAMAPTDTSPAVTVTPTGSPAQTPAMKLVLSAVRQYGSAAWTTSQTLGELRIYLDAV
ncbi:hypothetical protein [Nocardia sp. NPDC046763]|uniref:hypothetical protein n=1 Tax=Nocardia sp. NPDC046763 TaxID=3155256 RepID=UPI0033E0451C